MVGFLDEQNNQFGVNGPGQARILGLFGNWAMHRLIQISSCQPDNLSSSYAAKSENMHI